MKKEPRINKVTVSILSAFALVCASLSSAQAAYYSEGMASQSFCVKLPSMNSKWNEALNAGRNAWNYHSRFNGKISAFSDCPNTLSVGSYGADWFGLYTPIVTGSQYTIQIDGKNLEDFIEAEGYPFTNVVKSTTAHEFGHALSLGHTENARELMSHFRDRSVVTGPTNKEVEEVNGYYR